MRKILIVLGLALMVASCITFAVGANVTNANLSQMSESNFKPETLCKSGEKLVTPEPRNTLATPGKDFTITGLFACVDDAGHRRDITADVMQSAFGQIANVLPSWATTSIVAVFLFCLGLPVLLLGLVLFLFGQPSPPIPIGLSASPASNIVTEPTNNPSGSFTDQLRELEKARNEGLITQDEYDRIRQQLLDQLH